MELSSLFMLVLVSYVCNVIAAEYESCKTPNEEQGECIVIKDCASLYALIQQRPLSKGNTELLRKSHCGFLGSFPKVCCPNGSTSVPEKKDPLPDDDIVPSATTNLLPDPLDCGVDAGKRIVGGEKTELDEFPWMALITYELPNHHQGFGCGGVLISKRYVLTAAHCLKGNTLPKSWKIVAVRLGEYNKDSDKDCFHNGFKEECLKTPPIDVRVEERIPHEKYDPNDPNQKHDIALLRLSKDVSFDSDIDMSGGFSLARSPQDGVVPHGLPMTPCLDLVTDYIKPICLPMLEEERKKTYSGHNLTVAGWGQTENGSSSSVKLKLVVPVRTNTHCNSIYKDAERQLADTQLCAGGVKDKDSCRGDSGGPLMTVSIDQNGDATWYAAGIVSFGPDPCGTEGWPGVYTRVSKYVGWIIRHMKP